MSDHANVSARGRGPDVDEAALRERLTADRRRRRRDAALALVDRAGDGLDDWTVAALGDRVRRDDDPEVRQFAVEALGHAGAAEPVRDAFEDPEEWVRAEAVVALSRAAPDPTDDLEALLADDSGWVRRNAVIALGKAGAVDQATLVERIKTDPHPAVREYAAQFLSGAAEDVPEAVRILAALLARDPEAFVRAKSAESLGDLGTERAERALEDHGLTDRSEDVVRTAKRALASARGVDPEELDVDVEEPAAPGSGPDTPADRDVTGPTGGGPAPGGGPGFDPRQHLETDPTDRL